MLRITVIAVTALLSGCAATFTGTEFQGEEPARLATIDKHVPTSAVSDESGPGLPDRKPLAETDSVTPVKYASLQIDAPTSSDAYDTRESAAAKLRASAAAFSAVNTPKSSGYKIGQHDSLDISVFKVAELSTTAQVSEQGTISYPLVGEVVAAGKTARDVERDLTKSLGSKYLRNPQVRVFVKEYNSQRVTIEGAVNRPGLFPIQGSMSLLQAVALAGGMDIVSDNTVLVFRTTGGTRSAARFDIDEIRTGAADDPQLQAGDVIVAGKSALKEGWSTIMKVLPVTSMFGLL
jgi:polysaccharide export outer membrane protein